MARTRRIVIYAGGGLALIVAAVVAIGYLLPRDHVAAGTAVLAAPPAAVFETLAAVEHFPEWRDGLSGVELLSTSPLRWKEQAGGDTITFEVLERVPPSRLRVRIADPDLPFGGTWTYELTPEGSGTRLTITEHGEVYNPVFRFVSRFVLGHTATIDQFLADLQRRHRA